jgi:hypothetical protein
MSFQAEVRRILIASPGDVAEERRALPQAIHDWNGLNAHALGVVLLPVLWESGTIPEMGDRPQAIVNRQLVDDADILVATFWTRLGSPTGEDASGTVEEIRRFREAEKPILIYFSSAPVVIDSVDLGQYERLRTFRDQCRTEGLVAEYESVEQLRRRVGDDLTRLIRSTAIASNARLQTRVQQVPTVDEALDSYRTQLQLVVVRSQAGWAISDFEADEWRWHMRTLSEELAEYVAQLTVFLGEPDAALVADLRLLAAEAYQLSRHEFYLDGGRSVEVFEQSAKHLYANLLVLLNSPWSSYLVRRVSPDIKLES